MNHESRVRLNLALSPAVKARIEDLQRRTEAESMTEVLRRSLAIYKTLVDLHERGECLVVETPDGEAKGRIRIVIA